MEEKKGIYREGERALETVCVAGVGGDSSLPQMAMLG